MEQQHHAKKRQSDTDRPEVLIVSGDLGLSRFLHEGLLYAGFWPSEVGGGFQALEVFRLREFDLVIVDASVEDLTSTALAKRLKSPVGESGKQCRTDAPIILVAGDQTELFDLESTDEELFASIFIAPIEIEDLAQGIRELLDNQKVRNG